MKKIFNFNIENRKIKNNFIGKKHFVHFAKTFLVTLFKPLVYIQ